MDKKSLLIIALVVALAIALIYIFGISGMEDYCDNCRQEGMQNTLSGLVAQIKMRQVAIQINVGDDQLICSTRGLLDGTD